MAPPGMTAVSQVPPVVAAATAVDPTVAVRYRLHQRLLSTGPVVEGRTATGDVRYR